MKKFLAILLAMLLLIAPCALAEEDDEIERSPIDAMEPITDSIMRVIMENAGNYDPQSEDYVWSVLYLFGVNYGLEFPGTAIDDETYDFLIPGDLIRAAAASAFPVLSELPALPVVEGTSFGYDADADTYVLPGSDVGDSYSEAKDVKTADDGTLSLTLQMCNMDQEVIGEMGFELSPAADGATFPYVIKSVK